jgi:hypothetical protein
VHGALWWLRWLLPTLQTKHGTGMAYATKSRGRLSAALPLSAASSIIEEEPPALTAEEMV